ncbi:MAG: glycine-rich domain-containing protein, partial [Minisyncoccia bacterium]
VGNDYVLNAQSYSVVVGGGGAIFSKGNDSVFDGMTAYGGGTPVTGGTGDAIGGSGAGGGGGDIPGAGISGQGHSGGYGHTGSGGACSGDPYSTGGGGGASSIGVAGTSSGSGNGGDGIMSSISGSNSYYGGGGGGGAEIFRQCSGGNGTGGLGGGGNGGTAPNGDTGSTAGSVNTGGGGGNFRSGGSGVVIISYPSLPTIIGLGVTNRLAKFSTTNTIASSLFSDDGLNITLTSGNLFISGGSLFTQFINILADGLGLDTSTAGLLSIGSTTATSINIGRSGVTTTILGKTKLSNIGTISNCNSVASPAVCGSAPSGSVTMSKGGSTLIVNTTSVTPDSQIFIIEDSSLGVRLGITCNTATNRTYTISARVPSTSFTIKSSNNVNGANNACLSYFIVN